MLYLRLWVSAVLKGVFDQLVIDGLTVPIRGSVHNKHHRITHVFPCSNGNP